MGNTVDSLDTKIEKSIEAISPYLRRGSYLAYSGGKDSTALLLIYLVARERNPDTQPIPVLFSDTGLESPSLYRVVELARSILPAGEVLKTLTPGLSNSFWVLCVGRGYPVPNFRVRWCTSNLKTRPMEKAAKGFKTAITGRHYGESAARDGRLSSCKGGECGLDGFAKQLDPLLEWSNCDVWDFLAIYDRGGLFNALQDAYASSESKGSLRMGCFMCPVISRKTLANNISSGSVDPIGLEVRDLLEWLRQQPRIKNPRTLKNGAISWAARSEFWRRLDPLKPRLRELGFLTPIVEAEVNRLLAERAYPVTYKQDWIQEQEALL